MIRASGESNQSAWPGRVKLMTFKYAKVKDAVTYHSWWLDIAIFH